MARLSIRTGLFILSALVIPSLLAGQAAEPPEPASPDQRIGGPPAPVAPEVVTRDDQGNATVRATRIATPIEIDGNLDEALYRDVPAIGDFVQVLPEDGAPATERTEAWIAFDDENIYVGGRVWESHPESEWVANEMRRDANQLTQNDSFGVAFDTFFDKRNGVFFYVNPLGTRSDIQYTNEGNPNRDWAPIWEARTGRFEGGWTAEFRIPFKSLRYRSGGDQLWGIQIRRAIRHQSEWAYLTRIPRSVTGGGSNGASAVMRISRWGVLTGLETPPAGRTIEVKPYGISSLQTNRTVTPAINNDAQADAGLDVKIGVTESLFADLTVNTDFAQVEVDEQQVNLTRFEISFPEKREFFLEGRDIYQFAISTASAGGGGGGGGGNAPNLFFSRRIGLESGKLIPIRAGARVTGKLGAFDVGALSMRTAENEGLGVEATNFNVLRLRRDVLSRGSIGALFTQRSQSRVAEGSNETYGLDGNLSFRSDFFVSGYYAETRTSGLTTDDESYRGTFSYNGDLFGGSFAYLRVGDNFNPEVGFVRRRAFRESMANARFSPRPRSDLVRRLSFQLGTDYIENDSTRQVESRVHQVSAQLEFVSSESLDLIFSDTYELLDSNFRIADGTILPPGRYSFRDVTAGFSLGAQRRFSGNLSVQHGSFYSGNKTTVALRGGRLNASTRLIVEPSLSFNWVDLPQGSFRNDLAVTRVTYSFTPEMFLSGLLQYNSANNTLSSNLRLRWEYRPGSELFIVYTDAHDIDVLDRFSELSNRGLTIKLNYLMRL